MLKIQALLLISLIGVLCLACAWTLLTKGSQGSSGAAQNKSSVFADPQMSLHSAPHSQIRLESTNEPRKSPTANRTRTLLSDLDIVCIGLEHRKEKFYGHIRRQFADYALEVDYFQAIDGKSVDWRNYQDLMNNYYIKHWANHEQARLKDPSLPNTQGHLGAMLSHRQVIANAADGGDSHPETSRMTLILEDDAQIVDRFDTRLQSALDAVERYDPQWDILVLGCSCPYKHHAKCFDNDVEPVLSGGIARLHFWIGAWGYVIRSPMAARKIMDTVFNKIRWHVDIAMAFQANAGNLRVYGSIPPICMHPGVLWIDSFDQPQRGNVAYMRSDTNK